MLEGDQRIWCCRNVMLRAEVVREVNVYSERPA